MMNRMFDIEEIFYELPDDVKPAFVEMERRLWSNLSNSETISTVDARNYQGYLVGFLRANKADWESELIEPIIDYPMISNANQQDTFIHKSKILALQTKAEIHRDRSKGHISYVVLHTNHKEQIRDLVEQIKAKLSSLELDAQKKDKLFDKINSFIWELDRDQTRLGSFLGAMIQVASATGEAAEELEPVADLLDKIRKLVGTGSQETKQLPKWDAPKQITDQSKETGEDAEAAE